MKEICYIKLLCTLAIRYNNISMFLLRLAKKKNAAINLGKPYTQEVHLTFGKHAVFCFGKK